MKRGILNKELWFSFIAIAKYVPQAFFAPKVNGMDFYTPEKQQEFKKRIQSIKPDSIRAWGTMNVAQMLHHLALSLGGVLGFFTLPDESYWLSRTLFKWILVDFFNAQPKGLRLPLDFVIPHNQMFDFETEKSLLFGILEKAWQTKNDEDWGLHPMFGKLTRKQWGKLAQIHLDYHLKQFNA
ncbi:Protein of unknown function [Chitinophaga sp. YR573]|uniref:DUF1569 domain-containing protein n=1 Tax=Chitinophaga sp. YR573 TaxID=1881040 RepID=UPI0008D1DBA2|nr:DUF1569 domain-containing protein [Chitinophaga sp. YR573]SEW27773.1 Protein of unknown function [Chitinophaga sp. YR573]